MKTILTLAILLVGFATHASDDDLKLDRSLMCREAEVNGRELHVSPVSASKAQKDTLSVSITSNTVGSVVSGDVHYVKTMDETAYYSSLKRSESPIQQVLVIFKPGVDGMNRRYTHEIGVLVDDRLQTSSSLYMIFFCYEKDND
jgi:hypothetical protein